MSKLASLKVLQIINCHAIDDSDMKHLPSSTKIIRTKEEATKFQEGATPRRGTPRVTPRQS